MKVLFSLLAMISLHAESLVFVHLGDSLPAHLYDTIAQAHLFNPEMPIYLLANQIAILNASHEIPAVCIPCETLVTSAPHHDFACRSTLDRSSAGGFWFYTSERFFYLEEFVRSRNLSDVFHLENDILLYTDLETLLPAMQKNYPNQIATTFEQDFRCVPGFLYIPNPTPLTELVRFMAYQIDSGDTDMGALGSFRREYDKIWIDLLPIVPPEYVEDHRPLQIPNGVFVSKDSEGYCRNFADFQSVFDAAALGIYLAGDDPFFHADPLPGTINPNSVFIASYGSIEWERDAQSRAIPIFVYKGKRWKINNLHLTNKRALSQFVSANGRLLPSVLESAATPY